MHTLNESRIGQVIEDCLDNNEKLTPWEQDFVESLQNQLKNKPKLSEKQLEVLERIYLKI